MKILVVSNNYPSLQNPNYGAFVYNLMQELGKDNEIQIISPFKIYDFFKKKTSSYGHEKCQVHRPLYFSLSNKKIGPFDFGKFSRKLYKNAVNLVLSKESFMPDIIYVHFLLNAIPILDYANKNGIPIVVASGESNYNSFERYSSRLRRDLTKNIKHIICVSNENKRQLIDLGFDSNEISVIPNAVDYDVFRQLNKSECKESLRIKPDTFVVGFIGHFIHRKGPNRVIQAIKQLNDDNIKLICVGSKGTLEDNDFTIQLPPVPNKALPALYNSFDVFVLPTLHEGSCNVIEEAKACCIPVISSKGTSVEEQIENKKTGLLIDPLNIDEISKNINLIKNDPLLRNNIIEGLIRLRGTNSLKVRASKIELVLKNMIS